MTREQAIIYLVNNSIFTEKECKETDAGKFYVKNIMDGHDLYSTDVYAWFNTLFQYDIGYEKGRALDSYFYEKDLESTELTYKDKALFEEADRETKTDLDFSKWIKYEPSSYEYFN